MLEQVLFVCIRGGVVLTVAAVGLTASLQDAIFLLRRPRKLLPALASMNVVMPVATAVMVASFRLRPPVELSLVALSVSPIPPVLPRRVFRAGGGASYTVGLLTAVSLFAVVLVPVAVELLGRALGTWTHVSFLSIAKIISITVLAPLAAGLILGRLFGKRAHAAARPVSIAGLVALVVGVVPAFVVETPEMARLVGDGTLAALVLFNLVGLAVGHFLGGPEREERTALALTTASRHPGVALVIARANVTEVKPVMAALVMYLIVNALVAVPYETWARRRLTIVPRAA